MDFSSLWLKKKIRGRGKGRRQGIRGGWNRGRGGAERGRRAGEKKPLVWPCHAKSWLIGKHSDAGRYWGQEEKGTTEDEMAGWHHWLDGRESEWSLGVGDGQGGLACCDSWGRKESDMTERLNWTEHRNVNYKWKQGDNDREGENDDYLGGSWSEGSVTGKEHTGA